MRFWPDRHSLMMKLLVSMLLFGPLIISAQEGRGDLRFVFYNVENLFDPFDDSLKLDDEFLPGTIRHWTWDRFLEKEQNLYKVLACSGGWKPAELVGLCEVENRFVLNRLVRSTPLLKHNYRIIHKDSPDERGIDVALLYLPSKFKPLEWKSLSVGYYRGNAGYENLPSELYRTLASRNEEYELQDPTRDILYIRGLALERDTIHILICHWPSRWEGYLESLTERMEAARTVKWLLDSIWRLDIHARILVAGDLNDELSDPSLSSVLRVRIPGDKVRATGDRIKISGGKVRKTGDGAILTGDEQGYGYLYHTGSEQKIVEGGKKSSEPPGTLKYQGSWYEFDHILVSGDFLYNSSLFVKPGGKRILAQDFLFEKDPASPGKKPFRTYLGYKYQGGFSDHLPVYIDIWKK